MRAEQEEGSRVSATWQAVSQLPPPNQDTLAFLVLHLQLIASTPQCKMPINNLARVFGPTVVGFSSSDMAAVSNVLYETEKQAQVRPDHFTGCGSVEQELHYTRCDAKNRRKTSGCWRSVLGGYKAIL